MTKLTNGTWVLIADGEKALFLVNHTDGEDPFLEVFLEEAQDNPPNSEQAANRRGRFNDGPSVHRSAVQDTDWHQLAKDRFAGELAEILYRKAHQGAFDRIVLVARRTPWASCGARSTRKSRTGLSRRFRKPSRTTPLIRSKL